jgi:hypothetical protein
MDTSKRAAGRDRTRTGSGVGARRNSPIASSRIRRQRCISSAYVTHTWSFFHTDSSDDSARQTSDDSTPTERSAT